MKKLIAAIAALSCVIVLSGCGSKIQLPENPIVYEQGINEEEGYAYLEYGDKIYVPFCAYEKKYLGNCIGYYEIGDENIEKSKGYVYGLKGYSSDEWIIDFLDVNCSEGMILREINATEIPKGLSSEYDWNNFNETTDGVADYPAMIMVGGLLYYDSGEISNELRCGMMDGEILTIVDGVPAEDNQSNFGKGYGYQYGVDTIEVCIDDEWHIFIPYHTESIEDWDSLSEQEKMERDPTYNAE